MKVILEIEDFGDIELGEEEWFDKTILGNTHSLDFIGIMEILTNGVIQHYFPALMFDFLEIISKDSKQKIDAFSIKDTLKRNINRRWRMRL